MDPTKPHGFFLVRFLVLMFFGDLTEACTCAETSLREACCKDDFVMRVNFIYVRRDPNVSERLNMFRINVKQVFKGPEYMRTVGILHSPESESRCGYQNKGPFREDGYLISGSIDEVGFQISKCHLAKPWGEVTVEDKMDLIRLVGRDCSNICAHG